MRTSLIFIALFFIAVLPIGSSPHAGWIENGISVGVETYDQRYPSMVPDGSGGCCIAWTDYRSGTQTIYVQRLDKNGDELWTPGGVTACTFVSIQNVPYLISDGYGNIIVVWNDSRVAGKIYAQKMDRDGNRLWASAGVPVTTYAVTVGIKGICSDAAGGVIVTWDDSRDGNSNIYVQRINQNGDCVWDGEDEQIDVSANSQQTPRITADGSGGAIITWWDPNNSVNAKAQLINANGSVQWTLNGEVVCGHSFLIGYPMIVSDGAGGAVIAWDDLRGANRDIYAQRVKHDGTMLWTADGELVCSATGDQYLDDVVSDGEWGAVVVWEDLRNPSQDYDIYAQRVDGWGNTQWTANGVAVCAGNGEQSDARIDSDGSGGYFLAWKDMRSAVDFDIFSMRINQAGLANWSSSSGEVCTAVYGQTAMTMTNDGEGNLLLAWQDERGGSVIDLYAQRIDMSGCWGNPAPSISSIRDIPGDQGGWVNVAWDASRLDVWPEDAINYYTVWRAIDEQQAMLLLESGMPLLASAGEIDVDTRGALRTQILAGEPYYWNQVALVYSSDIVDEYSEPVETLFDSTAASAEYHYFQIVAHGSGPYAIWASEPDSGCSMDDLAPCAPLALAGEQTYEPSGLRLTWSPNAEEDMDHYVIHRELDENFIPGRFSFLGSVCDTSLFDDGWDWSAGYWYKVSAVDIHGNESSFAVFGPDMVTGEDPVAVPDATFLAQNYPNPFNPSTSIAFGLKERGHVSLKIYDAAGRLVVTFLDESRPAGSFTAEWDGCGANGRAASSGVYFYRLEANGFSETRKMILLR